jgi:hypothetical protein
MVFRAVHPGTEGHVGERKGLAGSWKPLVVGNTPYRRVEASIFNV